VEVGLVRALLLQLHLQLPCDAAGLRFGVCGDLTELLPRRRGLLARRRGLLARRRGLLPEGSRLLLRGSGLLLCGEHLITGGGLRCGGLGLRLLHLCLRPCLHRGHRLLRCLRL
jgi:hypothetical protein